MPELLSPKVSIEERQSSQQQVNAVSTSNFATIGWAPQGPENEAILITSMEQYLNTFGGFTKYSDMPYALAGFFQNGGTRAYVVGVRANDAELAQGLLSTNFLFKAASRGAWGNLVKAQISGNSNYYDEATASYSKFDVNILKESADGEGDFDVAESYEALELENVDDANYITKVLNDLSDVVDVSDVSGGIPLELQSEEFLNESVGTGDGSQQVFGHTVANLLVAVSTLKINLNGTLVGQDDGEGNLSEVSGSGVTGTIDYETGALNIFFASAPNIGQSVTIDYYKAPASSVEVDLAGGSDGDPTSVGRNQISANSLQTNKKGIFAFDVLDLFLNFGAVDYSANPTISTDVIAWAESRGDVFVVLDCGAGKTPQQAVKYKRNTLNSNSEYMAIYYPRIQVADELNDGRPKVISPVGHIVGCYARTDVEQNVGKSPAGTNDGQLRGILGLESKPNQAERDVLYPASVNPLREDDYVGRAIWGAKTAAIVGDFTRINARRLFIFLEKSFFGSTHDLVFENIGPQLWAKIKLRSDGFLNTLFLDGYFQGTTPEEAYTVVVDESNNPQSVINARQVITDYYIAVNEPGEFIRLRFQRKFNQNT